jgi:hypothetical protein
MPVFALGNSNAGGLSWVFFTGQQQGWMGWRDYATGSAAGQHGPPWQAAGLPPGLDPRSRPPAGRFEPARTVLPAAPPNVGGPTFNAPP